MVDLIHILDKRLSTKLVLGLLFVTLLSGCPFKLDDDKLDPQTQEGENTLSMLIDGSTWKITRDCGIFIPGPCARADYSRYDGHTLFEIEGSGKGGRLYFTASLKDVGYYYLNSTYCLVAKIDTTVLNLKLKTHFIKGGQESKPYYLADSLESELIITRFDPMEKIISGTFNMTLHNIDNEKLNITEGRFDYQFSLFTKTN